MKGRLATCVILAIVSGPAWAAPAAAGAPALPAYLGPEAAAAVSDWLGRHKGFRVLTDTDCGCAEDLDRIRNSPPGSEPAVPGYHPYFAQGDLNGDGREDLAVGVARAGEEGYRVLVLDSYRERRRARPFLSQPFLLREAMFFGPPAGGNRLLVGPFESEGVAFEPRPGGGYRMDDGDGY